MLNFLLDKYDFTVEMSYTNTMEFGQQASSKKMIFQLLDNGTVVENVRVSETPIYLKLKNFDEEFNFL